MKTITVLVVMVLGWLLLTGSLIEEVLIGLMSVTIALSFLLIVVRHCLGMTWQKIAELLNKYWLWSLPLLLLAIPSLVILVKLHWLGLRGTPLAFYFFWVTLYWLLVFTCIAGALWPDTVGKRLSLAIGNFFRRGGCVAVWRKDNYPANALVVVWSFIGVLMFLYGIPTPKVDSAAILHRVMAWATWSDDDPLPVRYAKNWLWVRMFLFFTPVMVIGWLVSRRDEFNDFRKTVMETVHQRQEQRRVSASSPSAAAQTSTAGEGKPTTSVVNVPDEGAWWERFDWFMSDLMAAIVVNLPHFLQRTKT